MTPPRLKRLLLVRRPHRPGFDRSARQLYRSFQPPFDIQKYPFILRMPPHCTQHQIMRDVIKETFDIHVDYPVILPTSLSGLRQRFMRWTVWPVTIRVAVKDTFQFWFEVHFHDRLGYAIPNCRDAQWPTFPISFGYVDSAYHRWHITPRGQTVPDLVQSVLQIFFKICNRTMIDTIAAPVLFHSLITLPDVGFWNTKWLCFTQSVPPNLVRWQKQ